jgi:sugar lactone lactonase YvrE
VIISGLALPTHFTYGPDQALFITELNGGENDATGRLLRFDLTQSPPTSTVILDKLLKPTGVAFRGDQLYLVSQNRLLVSTYQNGAATPPQPVFSDPLPFNGRSNGQLLVDSEGMLYFQGSGSERDPRNSGFIYTLKPGEKSPRIYARGFKNAYAFTLAPNGGVYATEVADGIIIGVGAYPDELNLVKRGGDYGWPFCYADQKENRLAGGNRNICADTDVPLTTFPPGVTPTGLAYFQGQLIVALWNGNPARLVSVDPRTGKYKDFSTVTNQPIALLLETAHPTERLLVLDFGIGNVIRIRSTP